MIDHPDVMNTNQYFEVVVMVIVLHYFETYVKELKDIIMGLTFDQQFIYDNLSMSF